MTGILFCSPLFSVCSPHVFPVLFSLYVLKFCFFTPEKQALCRLHSEGSAVPNTEICFICVPFFIKEVKLCTGMDIETGIPLSLLVQNLDWIAMSVPS